MSSARKLRRKKEKLPRGMIQCPTHGVQRLVMACTHIEDEGLSHLDEVASPRRPPFALCQKCYDVERTVGLDTEGLEEACGVCVGVLKMLGGTS